MLGSPTVSKPVSCPFYNKKNIVNLFSYFLTGEFITFELRNWYIICSYTIVDYQLGSSSFGSLVPSARADISA